MCFFLKHIFLFAMWLNSCAVQGVKEMQLVSGINQNHWEHKWNFGFPHSNTEGVAQPDTRPGEGVSQQYFTSTRHTAATASCEGDKSLSV